VEQSAIRDRPDAGTVYVASPTADTKNRAYGLLEHEAGMGMG
jgi:hypothetical protein